MGLSVLADVGGATERTVWPTLGVGIAVVCLGLGILLLLPAAIAWYNGQRPFGFKAVPIAGLKPGHAVLCGHVEPAWSCLTSPKARRPSVYYNAMVTDHYGKDTRTVYHRRSGIPFVLNDGSDRVLVLASTHSAWDPAHGPLDWTAEAFYGQGRQMAERDDGSHVRELLDRQFAPPPQPDPDRNETHMTDEQVRQRAVETAIDVGQMVTVMGWAAELPADAVGEDGYPDDGSSLGLNGRLVIGPSYDQQQVSIAAGTPDDVAARLRSRLRMAVSGLAVGLVSLAYLALFATGTFG